MALPLQVSLCAALMLLPLLPPILLLPLLLRCTICRGCCYRAATIQAAPKFSLGEALLEVGPLFPAARQPAWLARCTVHGARRLACEKVLLRVKLAASTTCGKHNSKVAAKGNLSDCCGALGCTFFMAVRFLRFMHLRLVRLQLDLLILAVTFFFPAFLCFFSNLPANN